jgi:hypothetical protein
MARRLKFLNAILCEHVAQGANKKHTLINAYSGDVVVDRFPADLAFGIYVEMAAGAPPEMDVELRLANRAFAKLHAVFPSSNADKPSTLVVPHIQLPVAEETAFSVVAKADGYAATTLIEKKLFQGDLG